MIMEHISHVFEIIFSPEKVLKRALELKKYWIPMAVMMIILSAMTVYVAPIQHSDQVKFIKENPKISEKLSKEQIKQMEEYNPRVFIPRTLMAVIISIPLMILVLGLFVHWFSTLAGIETSFITSITIVGYSSYIDFLWGALVKDILAVTKGSFLSVSTSFTLLFPSLDIHSKLYRVLSLFDFFNIWSYIVLGIGISLLPNSNYKKAFIIVGIIYIIKIIVSLIPTLLFSFGF